MLGDCRPKTHLPGSFAAEAASAAPATTSGGSPARSSRRSITRRYAFVSWSRFSSNATPSDDSSALIARSLACAASSRFAPLRTKSL